ITLSKTMKANTLFFILAFTFSMITNAQITKGNWMFGGDAKYSNKESFNNNFKNEKLKTAEFDINGSAGYFFIDNLQAGVRISYTDFRYRYTNTDSNRYWVKYGAYSRYYFLKPEKIVNVFLDGGYFLGNSVFESGDYKDNLNGFSISAGPTIFFTNSAAMELALNYFSTKLKGANDGTENNLQFSLGFKIFLEKQ